MRRRDGPDADGPRRANVGRRAAQAAEPGGQLRFRMGATGPGAVVLRKLNALHDHVTALRERLSADDEAEGARDAASSLLLTICELLAPDAKRLIAAASHNGLRERHVRIIHEEAGIDLGSQLPLGEVLRQLRASADVEAALAKMEAVAAEAGDEHEVELALTRMIETVAIEHARRTVQLQGSSDD